MTSNLNFVKTRDSSYDFIRFFAMFLIIIFHLFTTLNNFHYPYPAFFNNIIFRGSIGWGGVGVAIFFILSGALLLKNYKQTFSLRSFYLKRFIKIEIPQMLSFACAFALMYCLNPYIKNTDFVSLFVSFVGLGYSGYAWETLKIYPIWIIGEWFTAVIIICYRMFPLYRILFLKHRWISSTVIGTLFLLNLKYQILTYDGGWFSITNGLTYFWLGMLFEEYKSHLLKNKIFYTNCLFLLLFYYFNPKEILTIAYLPCFIFSISAFVALYKVTISNFLTRYICKYNYEIYLVHHRVYILFLPALLNDKSNAIQLLIAGTTVIIITFLLSEVLQKLSNYVIKTRTNFSLTKITIPLFIIRTLHIDHQQSSTDN